MNHYASYQAVARVTSRPRFLPSSFRLFCTPSASQAQASLGPPTVDATSLDVEESTSTAAQPTSLDALFKMQSRRRVFGSPILPLEAVAVHGPVQQRIESALEASGMTPRDVRKHSMLFDSVVAPETAMERRLPKRGLPVVRSPSQYSSPDALSYAVTRAPGTLATNVYVMAETRRCLPDFHPRSILDFGSGVGVSVMAAARVFNEDPFDAIASYLEQLRGSYEQPRADSNDEQLGAKDGRSFFTHATLVDRSNAMQSLASEVLPADVSIGKQIKLTQVSAIREVPVSNVNDIVCASYSLSEIVRNAMAKPSEEDAEADLGESVHREDRVKLAERRLKRTLKALWARTAPGGLLIILEDGTAAGFETVLFARETILQLAAASKQSSDLVDVDLSSEAETEGEMDSDLPVQEVGHSSASAARVIAPCLHSAKCPLIGSVNRHRICRFQQRLNRPSFLRTSRPMPTGYQDEYFSYVVIQKITSPDEPMEDADSSSDKPWGRLVRAPLTKGKHVMLDACTADGKLERRVVSKKNALPQHYPRARKAKWGDIWPVAPRSGPQPVNF